MTEAATTNRDRHVAKHDATRYVVPVDWLTRSTFRFINVMIVGFDIFGLLSAFGIADAIASGRKLGLELLGFLLALTGIVTLYAFKAFASVTSAELDLAKKIVLLTKRTATGSTIEYIPFDELRAATAYRDIGPLGAYCGVRLVLKNGRSIDLDTYKSSIKKAQAIGDRISALCEIPPSEPINPYKIYASARPS
ncbi:MAG TPA: hypothetical protein PK970_03620 [Hyphomicrobiaceae bacterium]|nr:hypothetical protein [Hyphomicrobiaceae bacterium]